MKPKVDLKQRAEAQGGVLACLAQDTKENDLDDEAAKPRKSKGSNAEGVSEKIRVQHMGNPGGAASSSKDGVKKTNPQLEKGLETVIANLKQKKKNTQDDDAKDNVDQQQVSAEKKDRRTKPDTKPQQPPSKKIRRQPRGE